MYSSYLSKPEGERILYLDRSCSLACLDTMESSCPGSDSHILRLLHEQAQILVQSSLLLTFLHQGLWQILTEKGEARKEQLDVGWRLWSHIEMFMLKRTSKLILDNRKLLHGDVDTVLLGSALQTPWESSETERAPNAQCPQMWRLSPSSSPCTPHWLCCWASRMPLVIMMLDHLIKTSILSTIRK